MPPASGLYTIHWSLPEAVGVYRIVVDAEISDSNLGCSARNVAFLPALKHERRGKCALRNQAVHRSCIGGAQGQIIIAKGERADVDRSSCSLIRGAGITAFSKYQRTTRVILITRVYAAPSDRPPRSMTRLRRKITRHDLMIRSACTLVKSEFSP